MRSCRHCEGQSSAALHTTFTCCKLFRVKLSRLARTRPFQGGNLEESLVIMVANTLWVLSLCLAPLAMAAPQSKVYWDYWDYYYYCYYVTAPASPPVLMLRSCARPKHG